MEIIKPVEHGEVDLFIGSDYFEKLLLPLEHGIGKPREPVGVAPFGWTIVGHILEVANDCHVANHIYTFHATLRDDELIRKMWDEGVMESLI